MARKKQPNQTVAKTTEDSSGFKFFAGLARICIRFRWLVLLVWFIAMIVIVGNFPSLSSVTQSNNTNFLPASSPIEKALSLETAFQPSNLVVIPLIVAGSSPINSTDQATISQLQASITGVNGVKHVVDRGRSSDGEAELLEIQAANSANTNPNGLIGDIRTAMAKVSLPSGLQAHLSGQLADQTDNSKGSNKQNTDLQIGTVIFIVLLLLFIFRAPLAPLITLIPPLIVVTTAGPIIAEASKHGLKVSSLAQLLLTVLILGAGADYGLFLIFRVREEIEGGLEPREAIVKGLSRVGESISFSAATVIVALLSLLLASFQIYSYLGIPLAIGVFLMLLAGLTLLPALLAIFGRAVFWPLKPQNRKSKKFGLWGKVCARVVQRPVLVMVVGVVFFGGLALFVPGYKAGGFGGSTNPPAGSDAAKGDSLLAKHFPSNSSNPTQVVFRLPQPIWQNAQPATKAGQELNQSSQFNHITGPLNPNGASLSVAQLMQLHSTLGSPSTLPTQQPASNSTAPKLYQAFRASAAYISPDGRTIQYAVGLNSGDPGGTKAMNAVPATRAEVSKIGNDIGAQQSGLVGQSAALYDISKISDSDIIKIIPIAVLVIGLLLGLLMRSLVAPIYLVASVVLSYLAALGVSVLIFMHLAGDSGLVFILPFLMFIFLLALGEDYNILVMTRIREEAHELSLKKAVTQALNTTGTTVTSAGLVLAGTFGVLGVVSGSGNPQVQEIGFGLAIGILMDTFLVRTLLVPSIVVILGRWNWWPTKHGSWVDQED